MRIQIPTTSLAALTTAVIFTGCCGPSQERRAYYPTPARTAQAAERPMQRTQVREQQAPTTARQEAVAGDEILIPLHAENLKVGKRQVDNGTVRLRKTVKTETASQPIQLRREKVTIDRESFENAQRAAAAGQPNVAGALFEEKVIVIDLTREEPVVEVEPYLSSRVVAKKSATTEQQNIQRQVRFETVEVIKEGETQDIVVSERVTQDAVGAPGNRGQREINNGRGLENGNQPKLENNNNQRDLNNQP